LIWQETHAFSPLFPVRLLRRREIWMADVLAVCHGAALVSLATLLPIYLHVIKGASASQSGVALLPLMFGIGTGSMVTGRLVSRTGSTAIFPSIGLTAATLLLMHLALAIDGWSHGKMMFWMLLVGVPMGTIMGVVQVTVQTIAGREQIGAAAASVQISRAIGAATGATITGAVLFATLQFGDPDGVHAFEALFGETRAVAAALPAATTQAISSAFRAAFLTIAIFTAIGATVAWRYPKRRL
jgi:predicted MFS family arabinose efflux permease